jgi:hypothetical protein
MYGLKNVKTNLMAISTLVGDIHKIYTIIPKTTTLTQSAS